MSLSPTPPPTHLYGKTDDKKRVDKKIHTHYPILTSYRTTYTHILTQIVYTAYYYNQKSLCIKV